MSAYAQGDTDGYPDAAGEEPTPPREIASRCDAVGHQRRPLFVLDSSSPPAAYTRLRHPRGRHLRRGRRGRPARGWYVMRPLGLGRAVRIVSPRCRSARTPVQRGVCAPTLGKRPPRRVTGCMYTLHQIESQTGEPRTIGWRADPASTHASMSSRPGSVWTRTPRSRASRTGLGCPFPPFIQRATGMEPRHISLQ